MVRRVIDEPSLLNRFATSNAGFHPVTAVGRNGSVPSLILPRKATDRIYCTDCHGSDSTTVKGPHGSTNNPLLRKNHTTTDNTAEGPDAYALCYSCHNRSNIVADQSFSKHHTHLSDVRSPCSACHDPHGVATNPHLVNFDRARVTAVGGVIQYRSTGVRRGSCTLVCHGRVHNNMTYAP